MAQTLQLTLVTPERALADERVDEVRIPGLGGYFGVLPGHAALFSELGTGVLTATRDGGVETFAIAGGFVEIRDDAVRVLADVAEAPPDVDVARAEASGKRAEERLGDGDGGVDRTRAQAALERARTRSAVARGNRQVLQS